ELNSPYPIIGFSPALEDGTELHHLQNLVDELVESEEVFLVSMKLLRAFYIDPIIDERRELGTPFLYFNTVLHELVKHHEQVLRSMHEMRRSSPTISDCAVSLTTLVGEVALDPFLSDEYYNVHKLFMKHMEDNSKYPTQSVELDVRWTKALGRYLEAIQPSTKRLDLSFESLMQKPIARIGKYRLLLDNISRYAPKDLERIGQSLEEVKYKLGRVNDSSNLLKEEPTSHISRLLEFTNVMFSGSQITPSFFGPLILCGAIHIVWFANNLIESAMCASFLFKGHLILAETKKRKLKWRGAVQPLFIISMARCQLSTDNDGGLFSLYPWVIKLIFEESNCHFEILFTFCTMQEYHVWLTYLTIMVEVVHGPNKLTFNDSFEYLMKYPSIQPCDVSDFKANNVQKQQCYYQDWKHIRIVVD
ncbi:uncharacterized protein CANTADRAFT_32543, partial [Suhomyces tanzawaensis NRRL Y-17324]